MCLALVYIDDSSSVVTIASNRDEWFHRPTSLAKCYSYSSSRSSGCNQETPFRKSISTPEPEAKSNFVVYGARDEEIGDDGLPLHGSPFLVSSGQRWAVITNAIRQVKVKGEHQNHSSKNKILKLSRGHVVTSFVCSSIDPFDFMKDFDSNHRDLDFDGFNLFFGVGASNVYFMSNRFPDYHKEYDSSNANHSGGDMHSYSFERIYVKKLCSKVCYGVSNSFLDAPEPRIERAKQLFMNVIGAQIKCNGTFSAVKTK